MLLVPLNEYSNSANSHSTGAYQTGMTEDFQRKPASTECKKELNEWKFKEREGEIQKVQHL